MGPLDAPGNGLAGGTGGRDGFCGGMGLCTSALGIGGSGGFCCILILGLCISTLDLCISELDLCPSGLLCTSQ